MRRVKHKRYAKVTLSLSTFFLVLSGIVLNVSAVDALEDCYLPEAEVVVTVKG